MIEHSLDDVVTKTRFLPSDHFRQKGDLKPNHVSVTRSRSTLQGNLPLTFEVVDTVDRFTAEEWSRVVAVVVTGQEWQFKQWKWKSPSEIMQHGEDLSYYYLMMTCAQLIHCECHLLFLQSRAITSSTAMIQQRILSRTGMW